MFLKISARVICNGSKHQTFRHAFSSYYRDNNILPTFTRQLTHSTNINSNPKPITIPELMSKTVNTFPNNPALVYQDLSSKQWITITYKEYKEKVDKIAKVLIKLGLKERESVAVLAFNCPEWFINQLATVHAGGQIVGIYTTNSSSACQYILETSKTRILFVDDDQQLTKAQSIKDKLPHLKAVIKIQPFEGERFEDVLSWSDLEKINTDDVEEEYASRLKRIRPEDWAMICYTSGTTGNPKGAVLTHDNQTFESSMLSYAFGFFKSGKEIAVSNLPVCHMGSQNAELFLPLFNGAAMFFADKNVFKGTLVNTLKEARPTYFGSVPRVFEKIYENLRKVTKEATGSRKIFLNWATKVTLDYHLKRLDTGRNVFSLQYEIAKRTVIKKMKSAIGLDCCENLIVGAAPLELDVKKFFLSIDINILEVYGMTEGTGISFVRTKDHNLQQLSSVGKAIPGIEVKIDKPDENGIGEVCTRGRNTFLFYLNDEMKTKEAIDEEKWLHTGDLGYLDKDGYLYITGRLKELLITAGGENIPYIHIENLVKTQCDAISNALLVGDKRKFLTLLITLRTHIGADGVPLEDLSSETVKWLEERNLKFKSIVEITDENGKVNSQVYKEIQKEIDAVNLKAFSNAQKVQKFAILPNDFSIPTGEIGPTLKLKRSFVIEKYKRIIDNFYKEK